MDSQTGFWPWGPLGNLGLHGLLAMLAMPIPAPPLYLPTTWSQVSLQVSAPYSLPEMMGIFNPFFLTVSQELRELQLQNYFNKRKVPLSGHCESFYSSKKRNNGVITLAPEEMKLFKNWINICSYSFPSLCFHSPSNENANYWPTCWYFFQGHLCGSLWKLLQFETNRIKWFYFFALSVT